MLLGREYMQRGERKNEREVGAERWGWQCEQGLDHDGTQKLTILRLLERLQKGFEH